MQLPDGSIVLVPKEPPRENENCKSLSLSVGGPHTVVSATSVCQDYPRASEMVEEILDHLTGSILRMW
jgi:hypothetical protein